MTVIEYVDATELPNPDCVWAFHVLVLTRGWASTLTAHAVKAADDVTPQQPERACVLLQAAERIGRAVQDIEAAKGYVPCPTTT